MLHYDGHERLFYARLPPIERNTLKIAHVTKFIDFILDCTTNLFRGQRVGSGHFAGIGKKAWVQFGYDIFKQALKGTCRLGFRSKCASSIPRISWVQARPLAYEPLITQILETCASGGFFSAHGRLCSFQRYENEDVIWNSYCFILSTELRNSYVNVSGTLSIVGPKDNGDVHP
jgi:hypothetical protein